MTTPKVSVLTTTYNRRNLLRRCVDSVLMQSYANLEMIILDDGSTDGTRAQWEDREDPRVRYIYRPHRGLDHLADMTNDLLELATGHYVALIDSDDWYIYPDAITDMVRLLERVDGTMAFGGSPPTWVDGRVEWAGIFAKRWYERMGIDSWDSRQFFRELLGRNLISASAVVLRTDVIRSVGGFRTFPGFPAQDYPTWLELSLIYRWSYLPKDVSYRYVHRGQATNVRGVDLARTSYTIARHYFAKGLDAGLLEEGDWQAVARRRKQHIANACWAVASSMIRERRWNEAEALVAIQLAESQTFVRRLEARVAQMSIRQRRDLVSGPLWLAGRIGLRF
jgi:glycosyltransferase involved in cell wall biosynthesis